MVRRGAFALIWLGFVVYAFGFAPPDQPDTADLIGRLSSGDWADINPAIVALFNLMGVWPIAYAHLALIDGHGQKAPAWPFVIGSFGLGAFLLLPYLILRRPNPTFEPPKSKLIALADARWVGFLILVGAAALMGYGLYAGDWGDFVQQWQTSRFIHVMSLDFVMLWLLVPSLLGDDMSRRGLKDPRLFFMVSIVPLLGLAAYLAARPSLPDAKEPVTKSA